MKLTFERRTAVLTGMEVRGASGSDVKLTGYASTFDQSYDMGWYEETVDASAFRRTLGQSPDVRFLINHEGSALARTTTGTLTLDDSDKIGLRAEATVNKNHTRVADLLIEIERGDTNQMSFGFRTLEDSWNQDMTKRRMLALDLNGGDVSSVTFAANPTTSIGLRSGGRPGAEAIYNAIRHLSTRAASDDDIASVLSRALTYFSSIDLPNAQDELAEMLGTAAPVIEDELTSELQVNASKALLEFRKRSALAL